MAGPKFIRGKQTKLICFSRNSTKMSSRSAGNSFGQILTLSGEEVSRKSSCKIAAWFIMFFKLHVRYGETIIEIDANFLTFNISALNLQEKCVEGTNFLRRT